MAGRKKLDAGRRLDAGGRQLLAIEARGTFGRVVTTIAARPGSFEWKAARGQWTGPQEQAGRRARALWESCGLAEPRSPDFGSPIAGKSRGAAHGPQEAILEAMEKARDLVWSIGMLCEARLRAFLLQDLTVTDLAQTWGYSVRDMTAILKADLDAAAAHFGYDPRQVA